jgi:hypothetical protein
MIYICDSFGLGGNRAQDAEALRRCHRQLAPGGTLVFSHYLPYHNAEEWRAWLPERRRRLPAPWPAAGERRQAADGDELEEQVRLVDLDPLEQRRTLQIRAALWRAGQLVAEEEHVLQESLYFRNELLLLLAQAGFRDVAVRAAYTDAAATAEHTALAFVARKDGQARGPRPRGRRGLAVRGGADGRRRGGSPPSSAPAWGAPMPPPSGSLRHASPVAVALPSARRTGGSSALASISCILTPVSTSILLANEPFAGRQPTPDTGP